MNAEVDGRLRELASAVDDASWKLLEAAPEHAGLYGMVRYHLGWTDPHTPPKDGGKKLRSALCLLVAEAAGVEWRTALAAATAVDLVHNFSLIHDDIEDRSPLRRGRETVWARWGEAQAINAGDALLIVAYQALLDVEPRLTPEIAVGATRRLSTACRELTEGQYLDLHWETAASSISLEQYLAMIGRKTARLFQCAAELGAFCAGATTEIERGFAEFGYSLGLAFQVADDILGVWSPEIETGKTAALDVLTRKKALPATLALAGPRTLARDRLAELYGLDKVLDEGQVSEAIELLEELGAREQAREYLIRLRRSAVAKLEQIAPGERGATMAAILEMALPEPT